MLPCSTQESMDKVHAIQSEQHAQGCRRYPTGSTFANYSSKSNERFLISVNIKLVESKHFLSFLHPILKISTAFFSSPMTQITKPMLKPDSLGVK